jgi:hypothetical protein
MAHESLHTARIELLEDTVPDKDHGDDPQTVAYGSGVLGGLIKNQGRHRAWRGIARGAVHIEIPGIKRFDAVVQERRSFLPG